MVTDFLIEHSEIAEEEYEKVRMIYNILADKVETVAPFLVEQILSNNSACEKIDWLTEEKAAERFNSDEYASRNLLGEFGL